jgi:GDP-mannose 6-dehydrogenase
MAAQLKNPHARSKGAEPSAPLATTNFYAQPPVSIIGLGYVGIVSAACLAEMTYRVIGVDVDSRKVLDVNTGRAPLVEPGLDDVVARAVAAGRLTATTDLTAALHQTSVTFVCVGTPSEIDGSVDLSSLRAALRQVGQALAQKSSYHLVVIRSTIPVGTTRSVVIPLLEAESSKCCGLDFGLCFQPEFLRQGVAIKDFFSPPKTVIGGIDDRSAKSLAAVHAAVDAPVFCTTIETAELIKYVDNTWHAAKVAFANEIGNISRAVNVDSHDVMNIFVVDTKLNLSPYYLKPGYAFGGSCLPKDVRALNGLARSLSLNTPLIGSILESNDAHIEHALKLVERSGAQRIGVLGVTFKNGTDDLRESAQIDLIGRLLSRGYEVRAYDSNVTVAGRTLAIAHGKTATPATRRVLDQLTDMLASSLDELIIWSDLVIVSHPTAEFADAVQRHQNSKHVLDLVHLSDEALRRSDTYMGICW